MNRRANIAITDVAVFRHKVGFHILVVGELALLRVCPCGPTRDWPPPCSLDAARMSGGCQESSRPGLGSGLLKKAILRTFSAADNAGIWALSVHAMDDNARVLDFHFDFPPPPPIICSFLCCSRLCGHLCKNAVARGIATVSATNGSDGVIGLVKQMSLLLWSPGYLSSMPASMAAAPGPKI